MEFAEIRRPQRHIEGRLRGIGRFVVKGFAQGEVMIRVTRGFGNLQLEELEASQSQEMVFP